MRAVAQSAAGQTNPLTHSNTLVKTDIYTTEKLYSLIKWNGAITGGSIFLSGDSSLLLSDVLLMNNTARRGGAVAAERASLLLLNHSTLIFNSASSGGAAVAASDQVVASVNCYNP
jgi:predicted outer membrane repeat protein